MAAAVDPMVPRVAHVRRRKRESAQVWTLEIEEQAPSPSAFTPGQFNMLTVFGVGDVPISFSGDPASQERLVHTIRDVGAASGALTRLKVGDAVGLRGPFGVGWPVEQALGRDVLVVAGGLGLAPLRPALYSLLAHRKRFGRITLLYGTRSPQDVVFGHELARWQKRAHIDVEITVDHAQGGWDGHVGVVTRLIPDARFAPANTTAFVCGPEIMMRFAALALRDAGIGRNAIYLSLERNMKCAIGLCGHCQLGPNFICKDGPVFRYDRLHEILGLKEV